VAAKERLPIGWWRRTPLTAFRESRTGSMSNINYAAKKLSLRIVYVGPGVGGKTTNLRTLHSLAGQRALGDVKDLSTVGDRTLFFDLLPLDGGTWEGLSVIDKLHTVPGQVFYQSVQAQVLRGVDAIVFVADSSAQRLDANICSMRDVYDIMAAQRPSRPIKPDFPFVVQYNKRDVPDAMPLKELESALNPWGFPFVEAVAIDGTGVQETFDIAHKLALQAHINRSRG